ncbi:MAG: DUF805 domain-containing protein [Rhizobiaceae bacterium]
MQDYGYMSALRKYVTFSGRAPRQEYWMFTLGVVILSIIAAVIDAFVFGASPESFGILGLIVSLAHLLPGIAVTIRRLHDTNRTGWWILIAFVPLLGAILLLVFMVFGSDEGDNEYGPNPYTS